MNVLFTGESFTSYIAKTHESLRTGLRALYGMRSFGEGYPDFDPSLRTYREVVARVFPEGEPDLVVSHHRFSIEHPAFLPFEGMAELTARKAVILGDFWKTTPVLDGYINFIETNKIDYIFSFFVQPLAMWRDTPLGNKLIFLPPSYDPQIFRNWVLDKDYDVGFLAAGTVDPNPTHYPERLEYHNRLLKMPDIRYLYAAHPGWGNFNEDAPLVGKGFSRAINRCKIFVTTGGVLKNAHSKVFECIGSRSMLMCDDIYMLKELGFEDGVNFVLIQPDRLEEQVRYYLSRPDLVEQITERGYQLGLAHHTCYMRAAQIEPILYAKGFRCQTQPE